MNKIFLRGFFYVLTLLVVIQFGLLPIMEKTTQHYISDDLISARQKIARGTYYLLAKELGRSPIKQWPQRIEELQQHFGYPIKIMPLSNLKLSKEEQQQLARGEVVISSWQSPSCYQIGHTPFALQVGPFYPFYQLKSSQKNLQFLFWIPLMALVALHTLAWVLPYWRKMQVISNATRSFGNGQLSVRIPTGTLAYLEPIATAFNTMADRIELLMESHKELTNAVSHELRTPLSRLRFGLEMLQTTTNFEQQRHYTQGLQTDVYEMEDLISELLTFAQYDRQCPPLELSAHQIKPLLHQVLAEACPYETTIDLQIVSYLMPEKDAPEFDPKYMARALNNLIQNGMKYTQKRLIITIERVADNCLIHVDDDGCGIPEADRKTIFKPFTRLDASRSRLSGGYGLGLAIVQRMMQWHQGTVTISQSPLGGARFTLSWPWKSPLPKRASA